MASITAPDTAVASTVSTETLVYVRPRPAPRTGDTTAERTMSTYAARGRRSALEAFHADLFTLEGDANAAMVRVLAGSAPQAFKDAFCETLHDLSAMFDEKI